MFSDPAVFILMYFILPIWLAAGFADSRCRASHIETTTARRPISTRIPQSPIAAWGDWAQTHPSNRGGSND
jgi:hypothetical protein